jgi:uncharacterized protein YbbC (DUF1343 family)
VLNGIDVLVKEGFAPLKKLKVGLITNHTGVDYRRRSTIDLLREAPEVELKVLFSPEHGLRGRKDEKVDDSVDEATGLPVFSLYGERKAPAPEQLAGLDALVFDLQDVGCRFYTYIATLGRAMEAAGRSGLKFFVLDRVNPVNGVSVEGPVYEGASKFIAFHSLPVRHGMTVGELARMFKAERGWQVDLTVIPLQGWKREMWFDETGLPWINPSPNMRNLTEAMLYPGVGLLETALSVGRGTDTPFEIMGAPYIDGLEWARALNGEALPGVRFVPIEFMPSASTFKGQTCGGVYILLNNRERCPAVELGLAAALTLRERYSDRFDLKAFNRLLLEPETVEDIRTGQSSAQITEKWAKSREAFLKRRSQFQLY